MKTTIKTLLYSLPLLIAASCDTTEDAYWPGSEPTNILSVEESSITLNADGTAQDINISAICSWDASLTDNENVFSLTPASGKGSGTVSVAAKSPNYGGSSISSTIVIKAQDFNKEVRVNLIQSSLTFEMESKNYPVTGAEGGFVDLVFNSTVGWELTVRPNSAVTSDVGSLDWFDFEPGTSGSGDTYETTVRATWKRNTTPDERVITLVLTPTDSHVSEVLGNNLPQPFTLRQNGGALPVIVHSDTISVSKTDIVYGIQYTSDSEVEEAGVRLLSSDGMELDTFTAGVGSYQQSGTVQVNISGLTEGTLYKLVPYVRNIVGEKAGDPQEVKTKTDLVGATITDYNLTAETRSISATVTVESDANVTEIRMNIYNTDNQDEPIYTYTRQTAGMNLTESITSANTLTPNTDYYVVIVAKTSVNEAQTAPLPIRTRGLTPDESDNNKPDVHP